MERLTHAFVFLVVTIPLIFLLGPLTSGGVAWRDPVEWLAIAGLMGVVASPFVAVLVLIHRRKGLRSDPVELAAIRFAALAILLYNAVLWLLPLALLATRPGDEVNFVPVWIALLQPLYVYSLLIALERAGRWRAARTHRKGSLVSPNIS